jgi:hypothetical protein
VRVPGNRPPRAADHVARAEIGARALRSIVPPLAGDRLPAPDIDAISKLIAAVSLQTSCDVEVKQEIFQFQIDNARVRF